MIRTMHRMLFLLLMTVLLTVMPLLLVNTVTSLEPTSARNILVLHSYHQGYEWTDAVHEAILTGLLLESEDVLHVEYLDLIRNPSASYQAAYAEALRQKLARFTPAVVLVSDDPALVFMQDFLPELQQANIVFCGINRYEPQQFAHFPNITGVNEEISVRETLDMAITLRPLARSLAVVNGLADSEKRNLQIFKAEVGSLPQGLQVMYLDGLDPDELAHKLSSLTREDIVLYLGWLSMPSGRSLSVKDSVSLVRESTHAAVFGMWDFLLLHGVIGGKVVHGSSQGQAAADLANQVLSGMAPSSIPVRMDSPNKIIFNEKELQRFGIETSSLPNHAVLVQRVADGPAQWRESVQNTYFSYELFAEHGAFMWILDPETGTILDANETVIEAYGYPGLIGMNLWDLNPLGEEEMRNRMRKILGTAQNRFLAQHVLADGTILDVQVDSYPITVGGKTVLFSIILDITDKLRTEQALAQRNQSLFWLIGLALLIETVTIAFLVLNVRRKRRSEQEALRQKAMLERMTDNAYDIMTIVDAQGRIAFQSNVASTVFGYPAEMFKGRTPMELLHPEDIDRLTGLLMEIRKTPGARMYAVYRMQHLDGEWLWLEGSAVNLLHDKLIQGILVSSRNITDRKREQEQLIASKEAAEQALQTQKRFLANMSHEIRTPMNGFLGMVQLLGMSSLDAEQREMLNMADRSSKALISVLNDILEMSRLEAGKVSIKEELFYPADLLYAMRDMFSLAARQKDLELRIHAKGMPSAPCLGDPFRIKQILDNLLGNAIKFTNQGFVELTVAGGAVPESGRIRLSFTISDTGIGMSADQMVHIFEPFSQGDDSMTKTHAGSGLGLAICKQLAELMGGEISVHSEWGIGSRFIFSYETSIGA